MKEHQLIVMSFGLASSGVKYVPKLSAVQEVHREPTEMSSLERPGKLLKVEVQLNVCIV
jgi:hypothetical protein